MRRTTGEVIVLGELIVLEAVPTRVAAGKPFLQGSRLGSRSYKGRGWEAVPTRGTAGKPFLQGSRLGSRSYKFILERCLYQFR